MRTEVKIGVAAAAFIGLVAVLYFVLLKEGGTVTPPGNPSETAQGKPDNPPSGLPLSPPGPSASDQLPSTGHTELAKREPMLPPAVDRTPVDSGPAAAPLPPAVGKADGAPVAAAPSLPGSALPPAIAGGARTTTDLPPAIAPVTPPVREPEVARERTYTVAEGDSLWAISKKTYGSPAHWKRISDANPGVEKGVLRVGQKLKIPALALAGKPADVPSDGLPSIGAPAAGQDTYVVQKGDNGFAGIAKRLYADESKWTAIAAANPNVDPKRLQIGQKLRLPAHVEPSLRRPAAQATGDISAATPIESPETRPAGPARPVFDY